MLEIVIVVVMAFHLLAMNLASAGPVVCIWLRYASRTRGDLSDRLGKSLAWLSCIAFLLGMLSGGALVLVPSSAGLPEAVSRFPARAYWMAGGELLFSLACLAVYAGGWSAWRRRPWLHGFIALLGSTNLLYHFPALMVVLGKLSVDPTWTHAAIVDRSGFRELMLQSEVLSLSIHFSLASIAVAAVAVLWLLSRSKANQGDELETKHVARGASIIALFASILQLLVGVWVLLSIPAQERTSLLGGDIFSSLLLAGGLLTTLLLLQSLATVALGDVERSNFRRPGWLLVATVLLMTATLYCSRNSAAAKQTAVENLSPRLSYFSGRRIQTTLKNPKRLPHLRLSQAPAEVLRACRRESSLL